MLNILILGKVIWEIKELILLKEEGEMLKIMGIIKEEIIKEIILEILELGEREKGILEV